MSISAFVITCNRPEYILKACLHAVRFVDELILINKGRALPPAIIRRVDQYVEEPWTPVVEHTRAIAQGLCSGDWIICLDDDEILSQKSAEFAREAVQSLDYDIYELPLRHYILGRYDPVVSPQDWRPALYRRGAVKYTETVHAGISLRGAVKRLHFNMGVHIDHLSHANVAQYLEKTNRYTSVKNRSGESKPEGSLADFARRQIADYCVGAQPGSYHEALGLLRALYAMVDGLKRWEESLPSGEAEFEKFCREVMAR